MTEKAVKSQKQTEDFDIKEIYTPLSVAKKEIWKRWNDKKLRKKVEKHLGDIPKPFRKEPRVVLSRSIITPNQEFFYFLDLARNTKLEPIGLEGVEDKFCTKNSDKVSLAKLSFYDKKDIKNKIRNAESKKSVVKIIDMMSSDGKRFCDIKTFWGENMVDFHHRLLNHYNSEIETFDDFRWFASKGKKGSINQYYENFFVFFLCHGILFENFITKKNEKIFTDDVVINSYKKVVKSLGVKPLVVPLLHLEDEDHWYFRSYIKEE